MGKEQDIVRIHCSNGNYAVNEFVAGTAADEDTSTHSLLLLIRARTRPKPKGISGSHAGPKRNMEFSLVNAAMNINKMKYR